MRRQGRCLLATLLLPALFAGVSAQAAEGELEAEIEAIFSELDCPFGPCDAEIGTPVGGAVTGVAPLGVLCRNIRTGQTVIAPSLTGSWDCEDLGLTVRVGDLVATGALGLARPATGARVGGSVRGVTPTAVLCLNLVTRDQLIVPTLASTWDCEALGLAVSPGQPVVTGAAGIVVPLAFGSAAP